jgi:lipoprotein signal peptidase
LSIRKKEIIVLARRARLYDALALLTAVVVISLDQWTKALVVANLNPPGSKPDIPLLGQYLVIAYIRIMERLLVSLRIRITSLPFLFSWLLA